MVKPVERTEDAEQTQDTDHPQIVVIENWLTELLERVPVR